MTDEIKVDNPWFIDEGREGEGERPTWLPEKFKSASDFAKGYSELEKKLGTAPDDYDLSKSRYLDPDYVPFQELKQIAKDKRVPQEVIDKMVDSFDKYMDEFSTDFNEEIKILGDNAKERITTLDNWASANLSKESYQAITSSINSAEGIKALEELRGKMMSNTTQIPGNDGQISSADSLDDVRKEIADNLEKFKTDNSYRKDIQKRLEIAAKNTPGYVDKIGG